MCSLEAYLELEDRGRHHVGPVSYSHSQVLSYFQEYIIRRKIIQLMYFSYVSKAQRNRAQYFIIQYKTAF